MAMMDRPKHLCLYPPCNQRATRRGLCHTHYQVLWRMVKSEEVSWEELEQLGKSLALQEIVPNQQVKNLAVRRWVWEGTDRELEYGDHLQEST